MNPARSHASILLGTDGSGGAANALDLLCALPMRRAGDVVNVATVAVRSHAALGPDPIARELAPEIVAAEIAQAAVTRLREHGIAAREHVLDGPVVSALVDTALATGSDLVVVGSRGRGLIAGTLLGSVARSLAERSPVPLLVVREHRTCLRRILVMADGPAEEREALRILASLPLAPHADLATVRDCDAEHGLAVASAMPADLIVLGSRAARLGAGLLPVSAADRVLSGAHCGVLVAPATRPVRADEPLTRLALAL